MLNKKYEIACISRQVFIYKAVIPSRVEGGLSAKDCGILLLRLLWSN